MEQLIPMVQKGIPDHWNGIVLSIQSWEEKQVWGYTCGVGVCLPKSQLEMLEPCFPGDG